MNNCATREEKIGKFCPNCVILTGTYLQTQNKQLPIFSSFYRFWNSALSWALITGAQVRLNINLSDFQSVQSQSWKLSVRFSDFPVFSAESLTRRGSALLEHLCCSRARDPVQDMLRCWQVLSAESEILKVVPHWSLLSIWS